MTLKTAYEKLAQAVGFLSKWVGWIIALVPLFTWGSKLLAWSRGPFPFLQAHVFEVWLSSVSAVALGLLVWTTRFSRKFTYRFRDNFSGDLRKNWDFEGGWKIPEKRTLLVTDSEAGGLSKAGATWENYTLTFRARIITSCLGVIIRGAGLDNYFMLQINADKIRPHRRALVPLSSPTQPSVSAPSSVQNFVTFTIAWQIFDPPTPIYPPLSDWFDVRIIVRGESLHLYIDDQLRFHRDAFLKIPMGKVGFRNDGPECALVKDVQVVVQA